MSENQAKLNTYQQKVREGWVVEVIENPDPTKYPLVIQTPPPGTEEHEKLSTSINFVKSAFQQGLREEDIRPNGAIQDFKKYLYIQDCEGGTGTGWNSFISSDVRNPSSLGPEAKTEHAINKTNTDTSNNTGW